MTHMLKDSKDRVFDATGFNVEPLCLFGDLTAGRKAMGCPNAANKVKILSEASFITF